MSDDIKYQGSTITTPLLIVFVVLKLTGNIDWSWWWVLSPLWIPAVLALFFISLAMIFSDDDTNKR